MKLVAAGCAFGAAAALVLVACLGEDPDRIPATPDAGNIAPPAAGQGAEGGSSVEGENLLKNADFESDCAVWDGNEAEGFAELPETTPPKSGNGSCRICGTGSSSWGFFQKVYDLEPGTYVGRGAMHFSPETREDAGAMTRASLELALLDENEEAIPGASDRKERSFDPAGGWAEAVVQVEVAEAGPREVALAFIGAQPGCFVIDSASLRRKP